ncbi:hypothetical protein M0812_01272 [Anaeramoeba flamelloides]|uniref:Dystroglycan-type cadherin-like domain-containing protein n=1 Tax=Anaeramoeba flamelloides TaxID=1746091 RepID=A0AAV8A7S4_9EUKA|nr:hypothetical protein M0812_01272 [Anaeramoeba flamelloides]
MLLFCRMGMLRIYMNVFEGETSKSHIRVDDGCDNCKHPRIEVNSKDEIFVVYADDNSVNTYLRKCLYTSCGEAQETVSSTSSTENSVDITIDSNDIVVVSWVEVDNSEKRLYLRTYDSDLNEATPKTLIPPTQGYHHYLPEMCTLTNNNIVIVWELQNAISTSEVQIDYAIWNHASNAFVVNSNITSESLISWQPSVSCYNLENKFVVSWTHQIDTDNWDVKYKIFSGVDGASESDEGIANYGTTKTSDSQVVVRGNDGFTVVYTDFSQQDPNYFDVRVRDFDSEGNVAIYDKTTSGILNGEPSGDQTKPMAYYQKESGYLSFTFQTTDSHDGNQDCGVRGSLYLEDTSGGIAYDDDGFAQMDLALPQNGTFEFNGTFTHSEVTETVYYNAAQEDGSELPPWITFPDDADVATFEYDTSGVCQTETSLRIKIVASDQCNNKNSTVFQVAIVNSQPQINKTISGLTINNTEAFSWSFAQGTFYDEDENQQLTYSSTLNGAASLPDWIHFEQNSTSREFHSNESTGLPPTECDVEYLIDLTASDGCLDSGALQFTITNFNRPPALVGDLEDQAYNHSTEFMYSFGDKVFDDPEGEELDLKAMRKDGARLPNWLNFFPTDFLFNGTTPEDSCKFSKAILITASDRCNKTASGEFLFTANGVPIAKNNDLQNQTIQSTQAHSYQFPEDDFTGINLTYTARDPDDNELPSWIHFDPGMRTFHFDAHHCSQSIQIVVTARDDCNESIQSSFFFQSSDSPPSLAIALADQEFESQSDFEYVFAPDTFEDPENGTLTYEAALESGDDLPGWLEFDPATRKFSGNANAMNETFQITVTAHDDCGQNAPATGTFKLTIYTENSNNDSDNDDDDDDDDDNDGNGNNSDNKNENNLVIIYGSVFGSIGFVALCLVLFFAFRKKKSNKRPKSKVSINEVFESNNSSENGVPLSDVKSSEKPNDDNSSSQTSSMTSSNTIQFQSTSSDIN